LRWAHEYDSAHPDGRLEAEALALRIQSLNQSGRTTEARALANEFQNKYPDHSLTPQLQRDVPR
jgi:outer membrane protein assembly factor BamD (BamD/ComL family)